MSIRAPKNKSRFYTVIFCDVDKTTVPKGKKAKNTELSTGCTRKEDAEKVDRKLSNFIKDARDKGIKPPYKDALEKYWKKPFIEICKMWVHDKSLSEDEMEEFNKYCYVGEFDFFELAKPVKICPSTLIEDIDFTLKEMDYYWLSPEEKAKRSRLMPTGYAEAICKRYVYDEYCLKSTVSFGDFDLSTVPQEVIEKAIKHLKSLYERGIFTMRKKLLDESGKTFGGCLTAEQSDEIADEEVKQKKFLELIDEKTTQAQMNELIEKYNRIQEQKNTSFAKVNPIKRVRIDELYGIATEKRVLSPRHKRFMEHFVEWCNDPNRKYVFADQITPEIAESYLDENWGEQTGARSNTYNNHKSCLNTIFERAASKAKINRSPFDILGRTRDDTESWRCFTYEEMDRIYDSVPQFWKVMGTIARYTGMRKIDCYKFCPNWIKKDDNGRDIICLEPSKTSRYHNEVYVPLVDKLKTELDKLQPQTRDTPFVAVFGVSKGEYENGFCECLKELKIEGSEDGPVGFHSYRHSFVTNCSRQGINNRDIQLMVGHKEGSVITENVYDHSKIVDAHFWGIKL